MDICEFFVYQMVCEFSYFMIVLFYFNYLIITTTVKRLFFNSFYPQT